ncbi:ABC transporter substrate-binding protein [Streptomyces peucetius]|uniref:ABC transporter substrate-binding protein n=1 Tax=Streptomyces peucetius TaxID=1950 RepID=A0ABY6IE06_STRPE|nr:ABC transporter substrate-binding protein [Streptomyces peucetius]UYQ65225.1 ABC transporter substrate-binding protein [Streptomyces peucetius]
MAQRTQWEFLDDRGRPASAPQVPSRLVTYIQAGAALFDHGLRPAGLFGSAHDGADPDPAKSGDLPPDAVPYLGSGPGVDAGTVLAAGPDLVVAVTYGSDQIYGLDPDTAKHIEERVPVVVIDVGQGRSFDAIRDRFEELAHSLGAAPEPSAASALAAARARLREAATGAPGVRVLALSPAGPDRVHLARPGAWPDLRALAECGVALVEPEPGPGANWSTTGWAAVRRPAPDIVLADVRSNAHPVAQLRGVPDWEAIEARARLLPWNPETPPSARAHARFFDAVAAALEEAPVPS